MRFEFSAGGIVFKKEDGSIFILVAQHSQHHGWVFPKGLIGNHPFASSGQAKETKQDAAVREVKEETGINGKIVTELAPVTYWYNFKNEKIKKTVYYYVMQNLGGNTKERDHEMEQVEWVFIDQVLERLTYKSDKEVFNKARPMIEKLVA